MKLYDYIYVDLDKVVSLYSQLTGGIVEVKETHSEKGSTANNKRNYDFKVFKHDAGGDTKQSELNKEIIKPHHSLLQELEENLSSSGFLMDLASLPSGVSLKNKEIRNNIKKSLCIKCTGRVVIEDYERMKATSKVFPEVVKLINRSGFEAIKGTEVYQETERLIKALEQQKSKRNITEIKELKKKLETINEQVSSIEIVPQWILDGMETWIDAFLPNITNIRVYPFSSEIDEHVFGHLDSLNFTTSNSQSFHFTYGSFPTEEFTMLGIVTSVPNEEEELFDPLAEFNDKDLNDDESIESAFRGVFRGFDGMEKMVRTNRYPRVLVHPILVYRDTLPNKTSVNPGT